MNVYKKRIQVAFALVICIILVSACDNGLRFTNIEVVSVPNKIEYTIGDQTALDFTGGKIRLTTLDGTTEERDLLEYTYHKANDRYPCITSDVNFYVPGEYTVTVWQSNSLSCQYTIIVQAANHISD